MKKTFTGFISGDSITVNTPNGPQPFTGEISLAATIDSDGSENTVVIWVDNGVVSGSQTNIVTAAARLLDVQPS